jgi:hypothetical protein
LHSIYGTSIFRKVTIEPTAEMRNELRLRFGERAERLIYLFHVCNRKAPNNIETGRLADRRCGTMLPGVSVKDVQDLRLLEAANMLDQRTEEHVAKVFVHTCRVFV